MNIEILVEDTLAKILLLKNNEDNGVFLKFSNYLECCYKRLRNLFTSDAKCILRKLQQI